MERWQLNPTLEGVLQAVDRLGCGLLVEDQEGVLRYANRRILELTGYEPHELDGQPLAKLVPEELHKYLRLEQAKTREGDSRTRLSARVHDAAARPPAPGQTRSFASARTAHDGGSHPWRAIGQTGPAVNDRRAETSSPNCERSASQPGNTVRPFSSCRLESFAGR